MTLDQLQSEVEEWTAKNFPNTKPYQPLLGVQEEVGELSHAHLKMEQSIRGTTEQHENAKRDAIGDIVIYLADYCNKNRINFQQAVALTWHEVKKRDWTKNRLNGDVEFKSNTL